MDDFTLYVTMGLNHVLDFSAYDHIIFLAALSVVYIIKEWKKVLWLVTLFTFGHSLTLALSAYEVVNLDVALIEFLIPVTIFITALSNIINVYLEKKSTNSINLLFALFFGLIHGLGFSNYFRMMIGQEEDKLLPLVEFALGIELAQIVIVIGILVIGFALMKFAKLKRHHWITVTSILIAIISAKMMWERIFW
ncbi:MAG: HupE/UreJ family protein [Flavobacteriaceae bacterium]|nr:HupE/UreJ family protein [Flavobacteriaceae bacterium]